MSYSLHLHNNWELFKQVTVLTRQNSFPFHCHWHPSISASLPLCFIESWDLPSCPYWDDASARVHPSEILVSTCFLGEISTWCCSSQGNSIAAPVSSMLICFQNFFHFLIWFLSTLWVWNPPGKGVFESLQFSLLSCTALLALWAEKVRQI